MTALNQGIDLALQRILKPSLEEQISNVPTPQQLAVNQTLLPKPDETFQRYENAWSQSQRGTQPIEEPQDNLDQILSYFDELAQIDWDRAHGVSVGNYSQADVQAMSNAIAVVNPDRQMDEYLLEEWQKLPQDKKRLAAQYYLEDPNKSNLFAEMSSAVSREAGKNILSSLILSPVTSITTPIAKAVTGQEVSKEEIINAVIMVALFAVPGLQGLGAAAQIGAKAIMLGAAGYMAKQTAEDWDKMSNAERAFAVGMDAALLVGGLPTKGFINKYAPKAKEAIKEMATSESGELRLGKEPIKPSGVIPVTGEVTKPVELPTASTQLSAEPVISKVPIFPETEAIIRDLQQPSKLKGIAEVVPDVSQVTKLIDPSKIARNPIEQAKILQGRMFDMAEGFNSIALSKLDSIISRGAKPRIKKGLVIESSISPLENAPKLEGGQMSMAIHDMVEFADRYNIPAKFRPYFDEIRTVSRQVTDMLEKELVKYDVALKKLSGESDWVYLRRVANKVGEVDLQGFGRWKGTQIPRRFATTGEGLTAEKAVTYLDPELELKYQLASAYNWITDLRVKDILTKLTKTPTELAKTRVAPELVTRLIDANKSRVIVRKLMGVNYPSIFSRAARGEMVPPGTLASVRSVFPEIADKLGQLMAKAARARKIANKRTIWKQITALKKDFRTEYASIEDNYKSAYFSYKNARDAAKIPRADEAFGTYLPNRVFTTQELAGKEVIGRDIMRQVEDLFGYRKAGITEKLIEKLGEVGGILRQTKASLDLSVQGIQTLPVLGIDAMNLIKAPLRGLVGIPNKPTASWIQGAFRGWERLFNPRAAKSWAAQPEIRAMATEMTEHGSLLSLSEFAEATGILSKIPLLGKLYEWSGAAFTWGRNATEIYLYMGERSRALKGLTDATAISTRLDELAKWSNIGTGTLSTRGMGVSTTQRAIESVVVFAPKLARSVLANVADLGKGGLTGRMARDSIVGFMVAAVSLTTGLSLALGQKPRINPLPESAGGDGNKFLTVKIGSYYIGLGSTYRQLASLGALVWDTARNSPDDLISFSMDNPILRMIRGKLGPPMALGIDLYTGHDYLGELTRNNLPTLMKTFGDWAIPIWADEILEAVKKDTPQWQIASTAATQFFGGRTVPETDWDIVKNLREIYSEDDYNKQFKDLNGSQIDELLRKHQDLDELWGKQKAHWAETGGAFEKTYYDLNQQSTQQRNNGLVDAATALQNGQISKDQYDNERSYVRPYYAGAKSILWAFRESLDPEGVEKIEEKYNASAKPEDKALNAYWDAYNQILDQSELPRDWDLINSTLDEFLVKNFPKERQYVLEHKDDWIKDLPEPAKTIELMRLQGIKDGTWWQNYKKVIPMQTTQQTNIPTGGDVFNRYEQAWQQSQK